jgi:tetratricopeptide (TPR) repeat protein
MAGMRRAAWVIIVAAGLAATSARAASRADEAVALCRQSDAAADADKRALLERGLAVAEAAVATDPRDAAAHFAVFCNLGKRMRLDGVGVASLLSLRRLRREIDRTLELDPAHADALVAKAALMYYTPRLLGGDPSQSEPLLRAALAVAPGYVDARLALARLLDARGARDEARVAARRALDDARTAANGPGAAEAAHLLASLGG